MKIALVFQGKRVMLDGNSLDEIGQEAQDLAKSLGKCGDLFMRRNDSDLDDVFIGSAAPSGTNYTTCVKAAKKRGKLR